MLEQEGGSLCHIATHKNSTRTPHDAHMFRTRAWEGRDQVHNAPEALISWTLACMCISAGNFQQGRENHPTTYLQNLPRPKHRVFFNPPPSPIARQHAEGGGGHFSVSPLPTPAVVWDRHMLEEESPRRQFRWKNLVRFF
jgi:hypothetical protein